MTWVQIPARVPHPGGYRVLELTVGLVVIAIAHIPDMLHWGTKQAFGHPHEPEAHWLAPRFGIPSHNYCIVLYI
mgnify:FL=1